MPPGLQREPMTHTRIAFSTVACPDWTLDQVAAAAGRWGYDGVELRTLGLGSNGFACDPALTAAEKVRGLFDDAGVAVASLATTLTFDRPVRPKVLGYVVGDHEAPIRQAKRMIDLAAQLECPFVRVFGFEVQAGATRPITLDLIESRLRMVVDHADKTGVKVALENGGSFPTGADLREILARIDSPLLVASYSPAVAAAAGEEAEAGMAALQRRLGLVKIKDMSAGRPALLGTGDSHPERAMRLAAGAADWVVYEWDRAFIPDLAEADSVLPEAARVLSGWLAGSAKAAAAAR
jgi:sugar phosphate isomerase/epimerase